jgi:hypothetical protein
VARNVLGLARMAQGVRSRRVISAAFTAVLSSCAGPGCGSDDDAVSASNAGSAGGGATGGTAGVGTGGSTGTSTGGSSGTGTGGTSGTSTGGSAGTTDAAAPGAGACASGWGERQELMRAPDGVALTSPALSPDELEVFYGQTEGAVWQFRRSVRDSFDAPFPAGEVMAKLETSCGAFNGTQRLSIDLSADGLTAYLMCSSLPPWSPSAYVRVARRSRIGAAFAVDPQDYGQAGPDFSISADELAGYSSPIIYPMPPPTPAPLYAAPLLFTRPTKSATFGTIPGAGSPVPGLETVTLGMPDPSPDGLWLFGKSDAHIVVAGRERLDAPFGAPSVVLAGDLQVGLSLMDPEVSRDCRRLYYLQLEPGPPPAYANYTLRVARR